MRKQPGLGDEGDLGDGENTQLPHAGETLRHDDNEDWFYG